MACFSPCTLTQSFNRTPPVSPEFGFSDQKVQLRSAYSRILILHGNPLGRLSRICS
jgi:hypothetical protein